jgi:ABC-type branched-subunit amino acid transport system substrate-binding protein
VLSASLDSIAKDSSVLAIITRMTDSTTEQATKTFEARGLPYLITTPVSADYTRSHPHAFLLVPTVEQQAQFLVDQAMRGKAPRRIAVMYVREPHAELLAQAIVAALAQRNVKAEFETSFSQQADELNMTAKAREIVQNNPTVLIFVGRSPSLMVVHGTIRNGLPDILILSSDLFDSFHVYLNPQSVYTGVRFVRYADPAGTDSAITRLRDRVTMWVGRNELNNESILAYDAAHALASAIKEGVTTRAALTEKLRSASYPGVAGPIRFGPEQRIQRVLYLAEVQNNGVPNVARSDSVPRTGAKAVAKVR